MNFDPRIPVVGMYRRRHLRFWLILMAAGVALQNMIVFPGHRDLLSGRCFDQTAADRHDCLMGSILERLRYPQRWLM